MIGLTVIVACLWLGFREYGRSVRRMRGHSLAHRDRQSLKRAFGWSFNGPNVPLGKGQRLPLPTWEDKR
jgi:hypothetical protein